MRQPQHNLTVHHNVDKEWFVHVEEGGPEWAVWISSGRSEISALKVASRRLARLKREVDRRVDKLK